jgi:hypothetical protein
MLEAQYQNDQDFSAVEEAYLENAATIVSSLWALSDKIMFKYASGFVNELPDGMSQLVGYPAWWLEAVGYSDGPPPPPTKPKCCHPDKTASSSTSSNDAVLLTGKQGGNEAIFTSQGSLVVENS